MTRAELETALAQQQVENASLRAQLAQQAPVAGLYWQAEAVPPEHQPVVKLMQKLYPAVLVADPAGLVVWASPGFFAMCGLAAEAVIGQRVNLLLRPDLEETRTLAYIQSSIGARVPFEYEVNNLQPNALPRWLRIKVQPLFNEQRELVLWAGMLDDITEWKSTQFTLAESQYQFQALAENVPGVLYEWRRNKDGTFNFGYVSPKLYELFGIPVGAINRMPDFVHPQDLAAFQQSMADAVGNQTDWLHEFRVVVEGQPLRWMQGRSVITRIDERGVKYSGILQDITVLREAQSALRERDLRLRLAVEGFGDGAWEMDLRTRSLRLSAEYKRMLGYADEEFPDGYEAWEQQMHPDDLDKTLEIVRRYLRGETAAASHEYRIRCKDGTYKWVLSRALITERDATGQPTVLSGLNTDVMAQKKTQEALNASSQRLSTVIANFQEGLVLEDENRRVVLANAVAAKLLQLPGPPDQLAGARGQDWTSALQHRVADPVRYALRLTTLLYRKLPVTGDTVPLRDGRTLQRDFSPVFDQDRYIGQLWKYEDITARVRAEEELKRREEKYRGIIENMSLGLVEADLEDHLLYANQSFCDMTGFCTEDLAGKRLSPILLSGDDLELVEGKLRTREHGVSDSYEVAVTTKTGERKWLLVSGAPLYDDFQRPVGSIGIYLDVTPQKQLEASLREAKAQAEISTRAKQDFLANMSHEIRTPMNAILGMSQLLAKTPLAPDQDSYLQAITASAENLLVIINDILDLSKIEAGRLAVEQIGFSLARVCAQVETTLHYKTEEKGLCFLTEIDPDLPEVLLGDPYRIGQILLNLAGNSVKFTEQGNVYVRCTVRAHPTPHEVLVEFEVQDTGIGIEPEYLSQIFEEFSQEDSSVTRRFGGTGLGLGISKKLVELLGGELHIESQKNHGTTSRFSLRLPVGSPHDLSQKDTGDIGAMQRALVGKRILLVEDNLFNRMLAATFLANANMVVTEAPNGQAAIELARRQAFDLVLMDVQMPIKNGYEATTVLREELGLSVPIIALTANAINGEREKCLAAGMNDYLTKPFQEFSLVKMVYEWVSALPQPASPVPLPVH